MSQANRFLKKKTTGLVISHLEENSLDSEHRNLSKKMKSG